MSRLSEERAALRDSLSIPTESTFELVEDAVVLVQIAQLRPQMIVDVDRLDRPRLHVDVPDSQREVIPGKNISTILGEFDVRDGGDDFGEEGLVGRIFFLLVY